MLCRFPVSSSLEQLVCHRLGCISYCINVTGSDTDNHCVVFATLHGLLPSSVSSDWRQASTWVIVTLTTVASCFVTLPCVIKLDTRDIDHCGVRQLQFDSLQMEGSNDVWVPHMCPQGVQSSEILTLLPTRLQCECVSVIHYCHKQSGT